LIFTSINLFVIEIYYTPIIEWLNSIYAIFLYRFLLYFYLNLLFEVKLGGM